MSNRSIRSAIRAEIESLPEASAFTATDFADIASGDKVRQAFNSLCDEGIIAQAIRGVYYKPRYLKILDKVVPPRVDEVAEAVARARGWTIAPSGDHALNMLGLDTQVPAIYAYVSSGPNANLRIGPFDVEFRHSASNDIVGMSRVTSLVVQALKALGPKWVDERVIAHLSQRLNDEEKALLLEETKCSTVWVRQAIVKIAEGSLPPSPPTTHGTLENPDSSFV